MASSPWARGPGLALGARALALPLQVVVTVGTTRLILDGLGVAGFAAFAVLVSLPNLISFAGVGIGAALTDTVAGRGGEGSPSVARVLLTSLRVAVLVGLGIALVSLVISVVGGWPALLGVEPQPGLNLGTGLALGLFGLFVPFSLGQSILLGAQRNHLSILFQSIGALVGLGGVALAHALEASFAAYAVAPYVGLLTGAVLSVIAAQRVPSVAFGWACRNLLRPVRGERIRHLSGAMTWIVIFSTIATQSDRLVLGHLSTETEVAVYAVALSLLSACISLIQAAGLSLWPVFAEDRWQVRGLDRSRFRRIQGVFAAGGVLMLVGFVVLGPWLTQWISNGQSGSSLTLSAWFGLLALLQAVWWPIGMLLTDAAGLRGQAWANLAAATINIAVSVALAARFGAMGPVVGTIVGTAVLIVWGRRQLPSRLVSRHSENERVP